MLISLLCHVKVILAYLSGQSAWSHHLCRIYIRRSPPNTIYVSYYITDTSSLCHVKVSLADSPGQSVWSRHLCRIYIRGSPPNTIYVSLIYHWHIFSMSCQGQSCVFPWSVCLIPASMSNIHPRKSTKYNICVPNISLTHLLYVISRSVLRIPLVSLSDPGIYVEYKSAEVCWKTFSCEDHGNVVN